MVYTKGKGFEKYSGDSHKYIRKMKEGRPVDNINKHQSGRKEAEGCDESRGMYER